MWTPISLCLLVVAVAGVSTNSPWKPNTQYQYAVRARTLTALHQVANQYSGVIIKANVTVQQKSDDILSIQVSSAQYSDLHANLSKGWSSPIPDKKLHYQEVPLSNKPFELQYKKGAINRMVASKNIPVWELNFLKSIASQLQVDTQAKNLQKSRINSLPNRESVNGVFKTMEDSVSGQCETLYDISPLPRVVQINKPHLAPLADLASNGQQLIDIVKTRNFSNCEMLPDYHSAITGNTNWKPGTSHMGTFLSRSSVSRVVISGNLQKYTIQSSVTTNKIIASPFLFDKQNGMVVSRMNLTLVAVKSSSGSPQSPSNPQNIEKLVYEYNPASSDEAKSLQQMRYRRYLSPMLLSISQDQYGRNVISSSSNKQFSKLQDAQNSNKETRPDQVAQSSESSSSSSSSESNDCDNNFSWGPDSEEEQIWQSKPKLTQAPMMPFLPFFIGNQGYSIQSAKEIQAVPVVKKIAQEIAKEITTPSAIPGQNTLQRFTVLTGFLRTMNSKQMEEASKELYFRLSRGSSKDSSKSASDSQKYHAWVAFRDAVAQAGTGPALLTIREWIQSKKVQGNEAAELISILPNIAQYPDIEYMTELFNLATSPVVQNQPYLGTAAILSVTELARKAFVNNGTSYRRFPVHVFGPLKQRKDQPVITRYIPYLSQSLKQAVSQGNSTSIRTTILALGNLAHPGILKVFEPYLEGKEAMTHFQRLTIVSALNKLAKTYPKVARSVLFRIYQNTGEATEVRVAAVFQIMKTNPPAQLLQRMAEFTNDDLDTQVISAVQSAITSAAFGLDNPEQELKRNAQSAVNLLNPKEMPKHFSKNYLQAFSAHNMNLGYKQSLGYIGSDDGFVPSNIFYSLRQNWGGYHKQYTGFGAMSSSFKNLLSVVMNHFDYTSPNDVNGQEPTSGRDHSNIPTPSEDVLRRSYDAISQMLGIREREQAQVEASLLLTTLDGKRFFAFDNETMEEIPRVVRRVAASLRAGRSFNYTKLTNKMSVTVAFPTATGLPFMFSLNTPTLVYIGGEATLKSTPDLAQGQHHIVDVPNTLNASTDLHFVYSSRTLSHMGFVAPFNRKNYVAGINKNVHINLPARVEVDMDIENNKAVAKIKPLDDVNKQNVFQYSTEPFTSQVDVVHSVLSDGHQGQNPNRDFKILHVRQPNQIHKTVGLQSTGWAFDVDYHSEQKFLDFAAIYNKARKHNPFSAALFAWAEDSINLNNITLAYNPEKSTAQYARFTVKLSRDSDYTDYNCLKSQGNRHSNQQPASSDPTKASPNDQISARTAYPISSSPDSQSRQQDFLKKVGKGIQSSDSIMLDLSADFLGQTKAHYVATVAVAHSNVSDKSRLLFFAEKYPAQTTTNNKRVQLCAAAESSMPNVPMMNYYQALSADPTSYVNAELAFGEKCSSNTASIVQLKGKMEQSSEHRQYLEQFPLSQRCKQQMSQGNSVQYACRNMTTQANLLDKYRMSVQFEKIPESVKNATYKAYALLRHAMYQYHNEDLISNKNSHNKIEIEARFAPDLKSANMSVEAPLLSAQFNNVRVNRFIAPLVVMHPEYSPAELYAEELFKGENSPTCVVDNNVAETFDNTTYPVRLGKCWHVMFHYAPQYDGRSTSNVEILSTGGFDKEISVLVRDTSNPSQKELSVAVNDNQVSVEPPCGNNAAVMKINGQEVSVYNDSISSFDDELTGEMFLQVYLEAGGSVRLYLPIQQVEIQYDGNAVMLKAPNSYRSSVRGLCGTFNGQPDDDFTTPQDCVLQNPSEFAATYALDDSSCEGPAKENKKNAQETISLGQCVHNNVLYGNVVTDDSAHFAPVSNSILPEKYRMESYRDEGGCYARKTLFRENVQIGYAYMDCFTESPQSVCAEGCSSSREKRIRVRTVCMEPSALTQHWKDMIQGGATPDFSKTKMASAYSMDMNHATFLGMNGNCPWWSAGLNVYNSRGIIGLHQEIEQFYEYISPTVEEHQMRLKIVEKITNTIQHQWPKAVVHTFGSFATGLYLPTSDIDLCLLGNFSQSPLNTIKNYLIDAEVCDSEHIQLLETERVPMIKLTEKSHGLKIDIIIKMISILGHSIIKDFSVHYPEFKKIVLVVKYLLLKHSLNDIFTGGISSVSLVFMTASFLRTHKNLTSARYDNQNLGDLLIEFFKFYGREFNYLETAIRVGGGESFVAKKEIEKCNMTSILCIENPDFPYNNLALSSVKALQVKQLFEHAYLTLTYAISQSNKPLSNANINSILGRIIRVDDYTINFRNSVKSIIH